MSYVLNEIIKQCENQKLKRITYKEYLEMHKEEDLSASQKEYLKKSEPYYNLAQDARVYIRLCINASMMENKLILPDLKEILNLGLPEKKFIYYSQYAKNEELFEDISFNDNAIKFLLEAYDNKLIPIFE